jgi:hypothetical protein
MKNHPTSKARGVRTTIVVLKRGRNSGVTAKCRCPKMNMKHMYLEDLQARVRNGKVAHETAQLREMELTQTDMFVCNAT